MRPFRSPTAGPPAGPGCGPGNPPTSVAGNTGGNNGVFLIPTVGVVDHPVESPWSFGLGVFEIGGFGVNDPVAPRNPILNPQVPFGRGVGPLYTDPPAHPAGPGAGLHLGGPGPLVQPFVGRVPGSPVRTASTVDSVDVGATVTF